MIKDLIVDGRSILKGRIWSSNYSLGKVWLFFVVQLLTCVGLFVTPGTAACQASLSFTISRSLPKLLSIESVMLSNHLILCHPLLLLPSIFPSIGDFSNESTLCIKCLAAVKKWKRCSSGVRRAGFLTRHLGLRQVSNLVQSPSPYFLQQQIICWDNLWL